MLDVVEVGFAGFASSSNVRGIASSLGVAL